MSQVEGVPGLLEGSTGLYDKRSTITGAKTRPPAPRAACRGSIRRFYYFPGDVYNSIRDQEVDRVTHSTLGWAQAPFFWLVCPPSRNYRVFWKYLYTLGPRLQAFDEEMERGPVGSAIESKSEATQASRNALKNTLRCL